MEINNLPVNSNMYKVLEQQNKKLIEELKKAEMYGKEICESLKINYQSDTSSEIIKKLEQEYSEITNIISELQGKIALEISKQKGMAT